MAKKIVNKGIKFVYLKEKTPYKTGFAHGKILKEEIAKLIFEIEEFAKDQYPLFFGTLFIKFLLFRAERLMNNFPDRQKEEMQGIADGCGQNIKWVLLANTIHDVIANHKKTVIACSAFVSRWKNTNQTILGKTTDLYIIMSLLEILARYRLVFVHQNTWHKQNFATLAFPGCLVGDSVIWRNGNCLVVNDGGSQDMGIDFNNLPVIAIVKKIATQSDGAKASLKIFKKIKPIKAYTFLTTGGNQNNSYLIDFAPQGFQIHSFSNPLINTNIFKSRKMKLLNYKSDYKENWKFACNKKRYKNLAEGIRTISSFQDVIKVMQIHTPDFSRYKGSIANTGTVQGLIVHPKKKIVFIPSGNKIPVTWYGKWKKFRFGEIF